MTDTRGTKTSNFGVSRRESHDATDFYSRFLPPIISESTEINDSPVRDQIIVGDASDMSALVDNSVALVVTSPPYFAGKAYEEALGEGSIPATYFDYLNMLRSVFRECVRVLEPGGRIAVNVANLGRRPYRSLAADVTSILQNDLQLLLRGEVIWVKQRGSSGSCAWGSFQKPANPVLRDLSERVIIASKGRFDRALSARERFDQNRPSQVTLSRDEFMEATTDIWDIPPESAHRVGHPAPFPVALPERLIHLYTYEGDVVLDPFMGSGTTAVAAVRTDRVFVGYDTEPGYVAKAMDRVEKERVRRAATTDDAWFPRVPATPPPANDEEDFQSRAGREGRAAKAMAFQVIEWAGFTGIEENVKLPGGVEVNFRARTHDGRQFLFDVSGGFTSNRPGLKRTDTLWKALGKAAVLREAHQDHDGLLLLTTDRPTKGSSGDAALLACTGTGGLIRDVIQLRNEDDHRRLRSLLRGEAHA